MRMQLTYSDTILHTTRAAFIRGNSPESWLREMNRWGVGPDELECYVVPESKQSIEPGGLLVIFKTEPLLNQTDFLEPYGVLGEKLFLPIQAQLFPVVSAEELNSLLLWERQLFHPQIGLVGFSTRDALDLADLLALTPPLRTRWELAHPGLPARPPLQQIRMEQPTAEQLMESFKEQFETQPLHKIPGNGGKMPLTPLRLMLGLLSLIAFLPYWLAQMIQKLFGKQGGGKRISSGSEGELPGWLSRMWRWISRQTEDLTAKREEEIRRLLHLFENNLEEALKYAIPLDSPYHNRGTAPASSRLFARLANFDLRSLGGGGRVDTWDVSNYEAELRKNYYLVATKAMEAKDFKRAAYIYAHLLGDYTNAAKALEQGRYYREAAIFYRDHLKNMPEAALCLERGGLLLEAIELYLPLKKYEHVGDLYRKMNQHQKAAYYYEQCEKDALDRQDYLEAARFAHDKLVQPDRARQILLRGWKEGNQAERCLKQYFDAVKEDQALVSRQVQEVFTFHTPKPMRPSFLNVLVQLNDHQLDTQLLETSRNVAYEIISEEVAEGNPDHLFVLKKFLPEDHLVASDCSRYASNQQSLSKQRKASAELCLDKEMRWVTALNYGNQYLALGMKESRLHLVRGNWYGNFEYHGFTYEVKPNEHLKLIADPRFSQQVILYSSSVMITEEKKLLKNKYFDQALSITSPSWLMKGFFSFAFNKDGGMTALMGNESRISLHQYSSGLCLQQSIDCRLEEEVPFLISPSAPLSEMKYWNGHFYTYHVKYLMRIADDGRTLLFNVNARIKKLATSVSPTLVLLALATAEGCQLVRSEASRLVPATDFFAQDMFPIVDIQFLTSNQLIVAGKYKAKLYDLRNAVPTLLQTFETQTPIVAILTPSKRAQVALLEETGRIGIYEMAQD
jgi:tetratricopeptide (TPR) repeat protein